MPDKTTYEPGTLCWADLNTPDPHAARAFYTGLFGWEANPSPSGHTLLTLRGRTVASLMPMVKGAPDGSPGVWTTYVTVADVDAAARAVTAGGGRVLIGPDDVEQMCRWALIFDPQGAVLALFEPRDFTGAALVDEPGAYCGSELTCPDVVAAQVFYARLLDWKGGVPATGCLDWGRPDGRVVTRAVQAPYFSPNWTAHFMVEDVPAAADRAVALGGRVNTPPYRTTTGEVAVLEDQHGGRFAVLRPDR